MIPEFPEFKKLELSDRDAIESFTKNFPPYSDFNFVSMWSWDVKGEVRVAWLNNNLVVKLNDYITGEPFFSFLGVNKVNETAAALIEISQILGQKKSIDLIPEITAKLLDSEEFLVTEEPNHFDYIYDLDVVSRMEESFLKRKARSIKIFLENDGLYKTLDFTDSDAVIYIEKINNIWLKNKLAINPGFDYKNEFLAISRFFKSGFIKDIIATFIFIETTPVAYSVYEKMKDGYVTCHFSKADFSYSGVGDYLVQQDAIHFSKLGFSFMNIEQDLGIEGLKRNKKSFSTGIFIKKYSVVLK